MGVFSNGDRPSVHTLVRREAVLHLDNGETSIKGFLMEFFEDCVLMAKPKLLAAGENETELGGELLVFHDRIAFIQLLGAS